VERHVSSSVSSATTIGALGPNGEVAFISGNRSLFSRPPYTEAPVDIGMATDVRFLWIDGDLFVMIGPSAFQINTP
jgi:hypothetical protein